SRSGRRRRGSRRWSYARSSGGGHHGIGELLEPVGDLVEVAFVGDEDVAHGPEPGRLVQAARRDGDPALADGLPEQARAAAAAEAAPGALRGLVPLEMLLAPD